MKKEQVFGIFLCIILLAITIFMLSMAFKDKKDTRTPYQNCLYFIAEKYCNEELWNGSGSWVVVSFDIPSNSFGCQAPCGHSGIKTVNFTDNDKKICEETISEMEKG
jgi:hypothetical protein